VTQSFTSAAAPVGADGSQGMANFDPDILHLMFGADWASTMAKWSILHLAMPGVPLGCGTQAERGVA